MESMESFIIGMVIFCVVIMIINITVAWTINTIRYSEVNTTWECGKCRIVSRQGTLILHNINRDEIKGLDSIGNYQRLECPHCNNTASFERLYECQTPFAPAIPVKECKSFVDNIDKQKSAIEVNRQIINYNNLQKSKQNEKVEL